MKETKKSLATTAPAEIVEIDTKLQCLEGRLAQRIKMSDDDVLAELSELARDTLATGDPVLLERTAVLFIPLVFANFYRTAAAAQTDFTAAITLLSDSQAGDADVSLARVIKVLARSARISKWEHVEWVMEIMGLIPLKEMEPLVQSLVANIKMKRIYSDTKSGRTVGAVAERIQSLLGRILCRIDDPRQLFIVRPLIKVLPRVRLGVRNDLNQAWETVETLDDNYLHNKFSHELRERIHGRYSNQDLEVVEGYLDFLTTASLKRFNEALPFFILEESDQELRLGIKTGDRWSRDVYELLIELREQLRKVVNHDPSDFAEAYHALETRNPDPATDRAIGAFTGALKHDDQLGAIKLSGEVRRRLREEFFASRDPAQRVQLMMLDEDIERIVYIRLGTLYEDWDKEPRKSLVDLLAILAILATQLGAYGLTSLTSMEIFERAGPGRGRLYTSQARDLARMCINEYVRIAFQFMTRYRDIAMIVADNDTEWVEQFVGGVLRRNEMDLHRFVQLAEVLRRGLTEELKLEGDRLMFPELSPKELAVDPIYFGGASSQNDAINLPDVCATYGSKSVNLAHMAALGLPVPAGFALPSTLGILAREQDESEFNRWLIDKLRRWIARLERNIAAKDGRILKFGDVRHPLLLSVRSNSAISMPGIMTTIPNIGINEEIAAALARMTGDAWFAYETYRLFLRDYATGVWEMEEGVFEPVIDRYKKAEGVLFKDQLRPETMRQVVRDYKTAIRQAGFGRELDRILSDPYQACLTALLSVLQSWHSASAIRYREHDELSHHWGTGVIVERMRFGNWINRGSDPDKDSLTAVAITRDPHTTRFSVSGDYKKNAQGHDLVASYVTQDSIQPIETLQETHPSIYRQLETAAATVDAYFNAPQDMEFTVEQGALWVLQTRNTIYERRIFPRLDRSGLQPIATGVGVSGGGYRGVVGFLSSDFEQLRNKVELINAEVGGNLVDGVLLLVHSPSAADIPLMLDYADGWVIQLGSRTSHAALIANQHDISAVFGVTPMVVDDKNHRMTIRSERPEKGVVTIQEGEILSIEGHANGGQLFKGSLPLMFKEEADR